MAKKDKKVDFDGRIWPNILDFNVQMDNQLTAKANFLFGASTLIFFTVLNKGISSDASQTNVPTTALYLLLIGSFCSMVAALMVVLPKIWFLQRKERIKEDIFYYKNIMHFYSRNNYYKYIKDIPMDNARISEAYANQIYTLATHIIPYKSRLLKMSGWILLTSILISAIILFTTSTV